MLKNNMNPFKVMIISSWILLGIALTLKLLGADWFIASSNNQRFIKLCNFIDENKFLYNFLPILFGVVTGSIYFMAILKENRPHIVWFIILIVYASLKVLFYNQVVFFIGDIIIMIGLPLAIKPKYWLAILIGFALNFIFQTISMITKMKNYEMFDNNTLVVIILNIDYLIMLILLWLYRIKKDYKGGTEKHG